MNSYLTTLFLKSIGSPLARVSSQVKPCNLPSTNRPRVSPQLVSHRTVQPPAAATFKTYEHLWNFSRIEGRPLVDICDARFDPSYLLTTGYPHGLVQTLREESRTRGKTQTSNYWFDPLRTPIFATSNLLRTGGSPRQMAQTPRQKLPTRGRKRVSQYWFDPLQEPMFHASARVGPTLKQIWASTNMSRRPQ